MGSVGLQSISNSSGGGTGGTAPLSDGRPKTGGAAVFEVNNGFEERDSEANRSGSDGIGVAALEEDWAAPDG